jgi:FkbM family methyltransferase
VSYGARSGVWRIVPKVLTPGSVVYSVGVGNNIAWDLSMVEQHGVELHAFDPTPRSVRWIGEQVLPPRFYFHPVGLGTIDGSQAFSEPNRDRKFNYTRQDFGNPDDKVVYCDVRKLDSLQRYLGHQDIDILKMDIEGEEMSVLPDMLTSGILPGQLLVEFHYNYPQIPFTDFLSLVSQLRRNGYRIFDISERGYEFGFIHRRLLDGAACAD